MRAPADTGDLVVVHVQDEGRLFCEPIPLWPLADRLDDAVAQMLSWAISFSMSSRKRLFLRSLSMAVRSSISLSHASRRARNRSHTTFSSLVIGPLMMTWPVLMSMTMSSGLGRGSGRSASGRAFCAFCASPVPNVNSSHWCKAANRRYPFAAAVFEYKMALCEEAERRDAIVLIQLDLAELAASPDRRGRGPPLPLLR